MIQKLKQTCLILLFALILAVVATPISMVGAQTTPTDEMLSTADCSNGTSTPLTALFGADAGEYLVYVRLGLAGQADPVSVQTQSFTDGICRSLGLVNASGDSWQFVGEWASQGKENPVNFYLESPAVNGLPDANRPTLMLVSKSNPVCVPTSDCTVTINGRQGVVNAAGTLLNENTLHVVQVVDPNQDMVVRVDYYVDSKPAYSTPTLEPFNLRYVGAGKHDLATVITYASKQKVVINSSVDRGFGDELNYIFFSIFYGQRTLLRIVSFVLIVAALSSLVIYITHRIDQKRRWKSTHFQDFNSNITNAPTTNNVEVISPAAGKIENPNTLLKSGAKLMIFITGLIAVSLVLVLTLSSFAFQIYDVDGPSMNTTLQSGQKIGVNRLGKTWASVNNRNFLPKRGEVVVFTKAQSFVFEGSPETFIVKRVVGLPGERVVVKDGTITVYNQQYPDGFNPDEGKPWSSNIQKSSGEQIDIIVGQAQVFVVGDNRPESVDSRVYGPIEVGNIIGSAELGMFPFKKL